MNESKSLRAAQYIRMSTDTQNLSPGMQKQAIGEYAEAAGIQIVESYEDEGKSGLTLRQRTEMRRLLQDVTTDDCPFSQVLVYDVSRWGRFQDTDESAYYEFHCRMHGVEVVYVKELFQHQKTPTAALLKALKRAMAAEFSRELAIKVQDAQRRALALGFQIGRTPCIGVDRMAVAGDGSSRRLQVQERPRKGERILWIQGPEHEIALVRRIFEEYVATNITLAALTEKLRREGRTARGRRFTLTMTQCLIDSEIFYGEFTWGRRKSGAHCQRRSDDDPAFIRVPEVMIPIISKDLWDRAQEKRRFAFHHFKRSKADMLADLRAALDNDPGLTATDLRGSGCAPISKYREKFGSMREAMRVAGRDEAALREAYLRRKSRTHRLAHQFKRDFAQLLTGEGMAWEARVNENLFTLGQGVKLRFVLVWQRKHRNGWRWHFRRMPLDSFDYLLLVPVHEDETARELMLYSRTQYKNLRTWFSIDDCACGLRHSSAVELLKSLRDLTRLPTAADHVNA